MIAQSERRRILEVPLCGERVLARLESIGVRCLDDLAGKDAYDVLHAINLAAGHTIWRPPLAVLALANLIEAAERARS